MLLDSLFVLTAVIKADKERCQQIGSPCADARPARLPYRPDEHDEGENPQHSRERDTHGTCHVLNRTGEA